MRLKIWLALVTVYVVWGSTYLAIRFAVETIPPFLMAGVRFLIAGLLLYAWRRAAGDKLPTRIEWRSAAVVGLLLLLGGNGGVSWAEQYVPSGVAALIVGSAPLWMVILDIFWPGSRRLPNWQTGVGVLIGFFGIALLIGPDQLTGKFSQLQSVGVVVLLVAALLWAAGTLYGRGARLPDSPLMGTAMEMLAGGMGLLVFGSLVGEWPRVDLGAISTRSLAGLSYLILIGSLLGFASYSWLIRVAPTPLVSTYAYVNPMIAIFLGNLLAREPLDLQVILAALVIVSSVALINAGRLAKPAPQVTHREVAQTLPSVGDD